jgi:hypothetical protein
MEALQFINWFDMSFCNTPKKLIKQNKQNKQNKSNKTHLAENDKKFKRYMKEKKELIIKYNNIKYMNLIQSKQLQYFNDKFLFKNIRNSSTSNFISLNLSAIKNYIDYNTNTYNHYEYILVMIQNRVSYIDYQINIIKSNIYT